MTEATPFQIEVYEAPDGTTPFLAWFKRMGDHRAQARIRTRLARVRLGNLGDSRSIGEGLHELRINYGPGYRLYYGQAGHRLILVLCAGTKRNQQRDINQARRYWNDYRRRMS